MQTTTLTLILAAALLLVGQRLYWLFVGGIGFVVAMELAVRWLSPQPEWIILLVGIVAGLIGAVLAIFFQRLAVGLAAFFGGGHLGLALLANVSATGSDQMSIIVFVVSGIIAAILAIALLDWALIILSALIGASIIADWAVHGAVPRAVFFIVLFVIGVAVQASLRRRRQS